MEKGDILGHECKALLVSLKISTDHSIFNLTVVGIVESVGSGIKDVKVGDRVVASFNIACGTCVSFSPCEITDCSALLKYLPV